MTTYRSALVSSIKIQDIYIECYMLPDGEIRYSVQDFINIKGSGDDQDTFREDAIEEIETLYIRCPSEDRYVESMCYESAKYMLLWATYCGNFKTLRMVYDLLDKGLNERADAAFILPNRFE